MTSILTLKCPLNEREPVHGVITHVGFETGERVVHNGKSEPKTKVRIEDIVHFQNLAFFRPRKNK